MVLQVVFTVIGGEIAMVVIAVTVVIEVAVVILLQVTPFVI